MDDSMTMYKMKCLGFVVEATQKKVQRYQHDSMAGGDQQGGHREGFPQPVRNADMHWQGEMQYQRQLDVPNYNAAHYPPLDPPPPPPVSDSHLCDFECPFSP